MPIRVKPNVGYKRVPRSFISRRPAAAASNQDVREQMAAIEKNFKQLLEGIENATPEALEYALQPMMEKALIYVPVDTGDLRNSAYLETRQMGNKIEAEIGFGRGGKPWYAPLVHEGLDFYHEPPTRAKFLEQAINEHLAEVLPRVIAYLKKEFGF